jgi:hypothetical protein
VWRIKLIPCSEELYSNLQPGPLWIGFRSLDEVLTIVEEKKDLSRSAQRVRACVALGVMEGSVLARAHERAQMAPMEWSS